MYVEKGVIKLFTVLREKFPWSKAKKLIPCNKLNLAPKSKLSKALDEYWKKIEENCISDAVFFLKWTKLSKYWWFPFQNKSSNSLDKFKSK